MDLMSTLAAIPGATHFLPYLTAVVALCAAVAVALPRPNGGATGFYPVFYAVVNFIALNFGQAKNASAPASPSAPNGAN